MQRKKANHGYHSKPTMPTKLLFGCKTAEENMRRKKSRETSIFSKGKMNDQRERNQTLMVNTQEKKGEEIK
jgi:hypothetical protein